MNETVISTPSPLPETPQKKTNIWLIVGIVLIVLCCCCAVAAGVIWYLWNNGDALLNSYGIISNLI
jgi:hypothetical protein